MRSCNAPSNNINSIAPERWGSNFKSALFKLIIQNDNLSIPCEITHRWMSQIHTDEKSPLVPLFKVIAGYRQATTWDNVGPDVWRHMASLGHNELNISICIRIRYVTIAANTATIILVHYICKLSIFLSSQGLTHIRVPDLQMSCKNLIRWLGTRLIITAMIARRHALLCMHGFLEKTCW